MARVRALYAGWTFSLRRANVIEYAIVNENDRADLDIVMLSKDPSEGVRVFPDPERGWVESPSTMVRDSIFVLAGIPHVSHVQPNIIRLNNLTVEKRIYARNVAEKVLAKAEEIAKKIEETGLIEQGENIVEVDGLKFSILRYTPPEDQEQLRETLLGIYNYVTAMRKRVYVAAPVFVEITYKDSKDWYVLTLPRIMAFLSESPESLVLAGVIDPTGYKAPFFVVRDVIPEDLGNMTKQRTGVSMLAQILALDTEVGLGAQIWQAAGGGAGEMP